jgi:hypothetical protein
MQEAAAFGARLVRVGMKLKPRCLEEAVIDPSGDSAERGPVLLRQAGVEPGLFERTAVELDV